MLPVLPVLPVILVDHIEQKPLALPGPIRQKATKGTKIKATTLRAEFITTKYSNNLNPVPPKAVLRKHSGSWFNPPRFFFDLLFPSVPKKHHSECNYNRKMMNSRNSLYLCQPNR
jgi:hypothetical protein